MLSCELASLLNYLLTAEKQVLLSFGLFFIEFESQGTQT